MNNFYKLPLWLQIYFQQEEDTQLRGILRMTFKGLTDSCLLIKNDKLYAASQMRIAWDRSNRDYILIADESEEGQDIFNFYDKKYREARDFLLKYSGFNISI